MTFLADGAVLGSQEMGGLLCSPPRRVIRLTFEDGEHGKGSRAHLAIDVVKEEGRLISSSTLQVERHIRCFKADVLPVNWL